jgi:hypothetical protein
VNQQPAQPTLDIADDTFLVAALAAVAEQVADPAAWRAWWPDLRTTVARDRGLAGMQWSVDGALRGSMEIWLEPWGDGVILHWYLRAHPVRTVRHPEREAAARVLRWKGDVHALKDRLEAGREPGSARCEATGAVKERDQSAESQ